MSGMVTAGVMEPHLAPLARLARAEVPLVTSPNILVTSHFVTFPWDRQSGADWATASDPGRTQSLS